MQFDFQTAINDLNAQMPVSDNFSFKISRSAVVPGDYLFNTILPQQDHPSYHVNGGSMRIYPTMATGMPMDTPPKPIGAVESSFFNENTSKFGGMMHFPEERLRSLQEFANYARSQGLQDGLSIGAIQAAEGKQVVDTLFGFSEILLKSQWDNLEYLRGQALYNGAINVTMSETSLVVDYDIPAANKITRTGAGDSYYGTTSKWWPDMRTIFTKLSNFQIIMNHNTYYSIIDNPANNIRVVNSVGMTRDIYKFVGNVEIPSPDARDRAQIILYNKSGSGLTPKGVVKALPFLPDGKIVVVGELEPDGFELIQGSTPDPTNYYALGYTHIAPTVEGGRTGIWSRIYTPQGKPFQLLGETVVNALPVITNPKKVMILTTDMP